MDYYHIYPTNDLIEHEVDSHEPPCVCDPEFRYNWDNDTCAIIHNSLDRRECFE